MANFLSGAQGLADLYGQYQSYQNADNINGQVQGLTSAASSAGLNTIQSLQNQILQGNQTSTNAYNLANAQTQSSHLNGDDDIARLTNLSNTYSDPNSPYMQMARQNIERKDAMAGRRSQWGEREVQLAGVMGEQAGKYVPGLQNGIQNVRNGQSAARQGLAQIYGNMNTSSDRNNTALISLINGLNNSANTINTTGRAAANSANNQLNGLLGTGIKAGASALGSMFANQGSGNTDWVTNSDYGSDAGGWSDDLGQYF